MRRFVPLAVLLLIVAAIVVVIVLWLRSNPSRTASGFAGAWQAHDWNRMEEIAPDADGALERLFERAHGDLGVSAIRVETGEPFDRDGQVTAPARVSLELAGVGTWRYETAIPLRRQRFGWAVEWTPAILHPRLERGTRLALRLNWPERAPILGSGDISLTQKGTVVTVGLEPQRIRDRDDTLDALEDELDLDPDRVAAELDRPDVRPDWFIPLVDLREELYQEMRPDLAPIPGVVFRRKAARLAPTDAFARHVVGRVGPITAEQLRGFGPPYRTGDIVGRSGLEQRYERRLAGRPEALVQVMRGDNVVELLRRFPGSGPEPLRTTIDRAAQLAADAALEDVEEPAAIVALDANTGRIRAIASRPLDEPFNRALAGRYPPGSTFKIITSAALLSSGHRANEAVRCPARIRAGREFRNSEGRELGTISFREAFVESCNTAFVSLVGDLDASLLVRAAERFGFGAEYDLPLPVAGGRFPPPSTEVEKAAAAIGQGRVLVSPVHMASVAGAVVGRGWRPPTLSPNAEAPLRRLDRDIAVVLQDWMFGVVDEGTGTEAAVEGIRIAGKTGTAEFGEGDPPREHAWFVGFRGPLAFAVLVEGGGSGGDVAAPIAARFLEELG